jgi:3-oxoacyl-[acyl-carrier-protein] synthase II
VLFPPNQSNGASHRVVITGAGIVTALGFGWRANSEGFRMGRAAFRPVTLFDVSRQRSKIAAELDLPANLPQIRLSPKQLARLDRSSKMLLMASHEAWTQAGWSPAENLPIVLGTTSGGMTMGENYLRHALQSPRSKRRQATRVINYQVQRQAMDVCEALGFSGPICIISNACASGANAVGHAFELIRTGRSTQVLTGGYDALCQLTFAGFDSLQALSATPCRPFDERRDGLSLGEGAAILALESLEHAQQRGAEILGEITGYAAATDIHHLTQPHPQGDAALATMTAACAQARVTAGDVDYVNAHGTATPQNDSTEAAAINRWANSHASNLNVSSTKACVGHLLGAAGTVEALVCVMSLRGQWLPPEPTLEKVDPKCAFQIVRKPMDRKVVSVISNSFGFGGANATLVFRRWA